VKVCGALVVGWGMGYDERNKKYDAEVLVNRKVKKQIKRMV